MAARKLPVVPEVDGADIAPAPMEHWVLAVMIVLADFPVMRAAAAAAAIMAAVPDAGQAAAAEAAM